MLQMGATGIEEEEEEELYRLASRDPLRQLTFI
jgi:hypothetical protein